jgi:hypothetical protein
MVHRGWREGETMPDADASGGSTKLGKLLSHPLFILVAGTVLGSLIIPWITGIAAGRQLQREAQQKTALEGLEQGFEVDRRFNAVETAVESFHKRQDQTGSVLAAEQPAVRTQIGDLYQQFNGTAWWWFRQEFHKAKVLDLLSEARLRSLEDLDECYGFNLLSSTAELSRLETLVLADRRSPASADEASAIHQRLDELTSERDEYLQEMAHLVAGRGAPPTPRRSTGLQAGYWLLTRSIAAAGAPPVAQRATFQCWTAHDLADVETWLGKVEGPGGCNILEVDKNGERASWNARCRDDSRSSGELTLCSTRFGAMLRRGAPGAHAVAAPRLTERVRGERVGDCPTRP